MPHKKKSTFPQSKLDKSERQCKLLLYILEEGPVSIKDVFFNVPEYHSSNKQEYESNRKKFNRDLKELEACGFHYAQKDNYYTINEEKSFALPLNISTKDACLLRAICCSLLEDPAYPAAHELRKTLSKLSDVIDGPDTLPSIEKKGFQQKSDQTPAFNKLCKAINNRQVISFEYCNAHDKISNRTVEPFGLFSFDKHMYLATFDLDKQEQRCFRCDRMRKITFDKKRTVQNQYNFNAKDWILLPFQFGVENFITCIRFSKHVSWRAKNLCKDFGEITLQDNGCTLWNVHANSYEKLAAWCIEHGPGITPIKPQKAYDIYIKGLQAVREVCK